MKNRFTPFVVHAVSVGALAFLCQNAQSQNLYNDTASYSGANLNFDNGLPGTASAGNEVVLAGNPVDTVNTFSVQIDFTGTGTPTGTVDASFYLNNGAPFNGYKTPGTLLWDAGATALTTFSTGGGETLTYTIPGGVVVPQDFTFVVSFSGLTATEVGGLSIYGNTTTGMNYNDAWVNTGSGWTLEEAGVGQPAPQFGASMSGTTVPETSTIALGIMGACALLLGPMQFSDRLRQRFAKFHRVVGRFYVAGVFIGAPLGFYIQYYEERMGGTRSFSFAAFTTFV